MNLLDSITNSTGSFLLKIRGAVLTGIFLFMILPAFSQTLVWQLPRDFKNTCVGEGLPYYGNYPAYYDANTPVTYSLIGGALPPGLRYDTPQSEFFGTPPKGSAGTYNFRIRATANGQTLEQDLTMVVVPVIDLESFNLGLLKSGTLLTSGGQPTSAHIPGTTYAVTSGALPPGLVLDQATGVVNGTPTESGTYRFTIKATDPCGYTASKKFYRTIYPNLPFDLYTWGGSGLGDGTNTSRYTPASVSPGPWVMSAHGANHSLALKEDGTLYAWGSNSNGQLGAPGITVGSGSSLSPVRVCVGGNCSTITQPKWVWISAGDRFSVGITLDGKLYAWGYDFYGQLGDGGANTDQSFPTLINPPAGDSWISASCGALSVTALTLEGKIYSWGYNLFGQLGDGTTTNRNAPVQSASGINKTWISLAAGAQHVLAVTSDQQLFSWGNNESGQLGNGLSGTGQKVNPNPARVGIRTYKSVTAGIAHSMAIDSESGDLYGWGLNAFGSVGIGSTTPTNVTTPQLVSPPNGLKPVELNTGGSADHTLAITSDGVLYAWGDNSFGALGDGTRSSRSLPKIIAPSLFWYRAAVGNNGMVSSGMATILVTLNKYDLSLCVGKGTETLEATVNSSVPTPYTLDWSISDPAVASVVATSGDINRGLVTPLKGGTAIITVTLNGKYKVSATLTVCEDPAFTDKTLACMVAGVAYSDGVQASGFPAPTYSISDGSLPAGLMENEVTGAITGTPTAPGNYTFSIRASNFNATTQVGGSVVETFTVSVFGWVSENVGLMKQGRAFTGSVTAAGDGVTYAVTAGALPAGLQLNASTGAITGTPTAAGTYLFTIGATSCGATVTKKFVRTVYPEYNLDLYTWGSGQLGDGNTTITTRIYPNQVKSPAEKWAMTASGSNHNLALTEDGKLYSWGINSDGQLGIAGVAVGSTQLTPARVCLGDCNTAAQPVWVWIAVGNKFSLALTLDGKMYTWGKNASSQLGDGSNVNKLTPTLIAAPSGDAWVKAACGYDWVIAVTLEGKMYAWGNNGGGCLGDGTIIARNIPVQIASSLNKVWVLPAAGYESSLAITDQGELYGWGVNIDGQLGIGSNTAEQRSPVRVGTGFYKDVTTGIAHTLAITSAGKLESWGLNKYGKLGDGTTTDRRTPAEIAVDLKKTWNELFRGAYTDHSLAVTTSGELYGMGRNGVGQLGDSTNINRSLPTRIAPSIWWYRVSNWEMNTGLGIELITLDKYNFTLCLSGNTVVSETRVATISPSLAGLPKEWTSSDETIATVDENGKVTAIKGGTATITITVDGKYSASAKITVCEVPAWTDKTLACLVAGVPYADGVQASGFPAPTYSISDGSLPAGLMLNEVTGAITGTPTTPGNYTFTISASNFNANTQVGGSVVETFTVSVFGWVSENVGLMKQGRPFTGSVTAAGDGVTYAVTAGALPAGLQLNASTGAITGTPTAAGTYRFTIGATSCGTIYKKIVRTVYPEYNLDLYTWGSGQLGDGNATITTRIYPNQVKSPAEKWAMTASGLAHNLALTEDGKLYSWGRNTHGQLGIASVAVGVTSSSTQLTPARVCLGDCDTSPQPVWVWISAGNRFSLALTLDGKMYTWGQGSAGQLGDGSNSDRSTPALIPAPSGDSWVRAACGYTNVIATTLEGKLYAWGDNENGKLGDGTTTDRNIPVEIASGLNKVWLVPAATNTSGMAITDQGEMYAWGGNNRGQLGIGGTTNQFFPVRVGTTLYKDVTGGVSHVLALRSDGKLESWGGNVYGQLGNGTTSNQDTPTEIAGDLNKTWNELFRGPYADHSLAVTTDGELYGMGINGLGQLGDSTKINRSLPTRIAPSIWWYRVASQDMNTGLGIEVITLDKYYFTLCVGGNTETRTATVSPVLASFPVNWTSSDPTIATVDQNGKVTAIKGGTATITVTVDKYSASAKVTVNESPVANDDAANSVQDQDATGNVLTDGTADTDPDGDVLNVTAYSANGATANAGQSLTIAGVGAITIAADGAYVFKPELAFSGTVPVITYSITDGKCGTVTAKLSISVQRVFTAPDANTGFVNESIVGSVVRNDAVPAGTTYGTPVPDSQNPTGSVLNLNSDGTYTFTGTQLGIYTYDVPVCPAGTTTGCPTEKLVITVNDLDREISNLPILYPDIALTRSGVPVVLKSLANDDAGNPRRSLVPSTLEIISGPANGTATVNNLTGDITFTPASGVTGTETLVYRVCDNNPFPQPRCSTTTQVITVLPPGTANTTVASDEFRITTGSTPVSGNVLDNDKDPENNTRTVTPQTVTNSTGTFTLTANGTYSFTAKAGFSGNTTFPYTACDNGTPQACAMATVHIMVRPATIQANDDDFSENQVNGFTGGTAGTVFTNDKVNNEALQPAQVTLTLKNNGGVTGLAINATTGNLTVPPSTKAGTYTITYGICQVINPEVCDEATATVVVIPPILEANDDDYTSQVISNELGGKVGSIYQNDLVNGQSVPEGLRNQLTVTVNNDGGLTGLTIDEQGTVTVPKNFDPGIYTVNVTVCEKLNPTNCDDATVTIKIEYTQFVPPGVVTPNNDGKNDFFHIRGLSAFPDNKLAIYNRWGNIVYEAEGYQNDWDGRSQNALTLNGSSKVPAGTYFFVIDLGNGRRETGSFYVAY